MRIGLEAGPETAAIAARHGVRGVPIGASDLVRKGVQKVIQPLNELNLKVCQVGAFGYNPLHPDRSIRESEREIVMQCIPLLKEVDCRYIVICGGNYHPNGFGGVDRRNFTSAALDAVAAELQPLLRRAADDGVIISIEPYLKTAVNSADTFLQLHQLCGSDNLKANLDVSSLYDFWGLVDPAPVCRETCKKLAEHIGLVHVKEVSLSEGFHIHSGLAPLSKGNTDWRSVFEMVGSHVPDDSWVMLEHVQSEDEAIEGLEKLRRDIELAGFQWT